MERLLHFLKRVLHRPASAIQFGHFQWFRMLVGEIRQEMDFAFTVACRFIQHDRDPANQQFLAVAVGQPNGLLVNHAPVATPRLMTLADQRPGEGRSVLADQEARLPPGDPKQKAGGAEIAISDP
jgi:hypothetical protein